MIPQDDFTPHGYLDNPYHSWKLNPSGVLRSLPPLGMGWHVPNLGSYARNQFQYTAHLMIGLKIGDLVLLTSGDFDRYHCVIMSHLHTRNRFEYTCVVPQYDLTLTARYFLVQQHALGCVLSLSPSPVTSHTCTHITHLPAACGNMAFMLSQNPIEGYLLRGRVPFWALPARVTRLCMAYEKTVGRHSHSVKSAMPSRSMTLLPGRVVL